MSNIWYVSDGGSDENDCQTEFTPCKNLQTVLDRATDGADIYVTSDTLSLDAVHGNISIPWSKMVECCEVNSSVSYNFSRFGGTGFTVNCTCKYSFLSTVHYSRIEKLKINSMNFISVGPQDLWILQVI